MYLAGDGCHRDDDGDYWFMGRIDDVMNVSGHRISTAEVEIALVDHPAVAEAAVVGEATTSRVKRSRAFVTLKSHAHRLDRSSPTSCARTSRRQLGKFVHAEVPHVHAGASRRRAAARSCAVCCATSPKAACSATRRRSPIRASSPSCKRAPRTKLPKKSESAHEKKRRRAHLRGRFLVCSQRESHALAPMDRTRSRWPSPHSLPDGRERPACR